MDTVWVQGDQLNRRLGALGSAEPSTHRVLLVESDALVRARPFHRQRLHLVVAAMRRFAADLRAEGFEVDLRRAPTMADGLGAHRAAHAPHRVVATEPLARAAQARLERLGVELARSDQFLCHRDDFAAWAGDRRRLRLEDFYRWQRRRLGYLMDGDEPAGGRWNYDHENREPPPAGEVEWPAPLVFPLDELDDEVLADLPSTWGAEPTGLWPTSRADALARLDHVVAEVLPRFGPHEDAMVADNWHLAHTLLSPALNLGLVLPGEVCDRVESAYRHGSVPIASAEGFIRQVIGWREFVWGIYWLWGAEYGELNTLGHDDPLPPAFRGEATTELRCLAVTLADLHAHGWNHHIQRLMVIANLASLAGIEPRALVDWMWASYVDGAEWVMVPNVIGMGTYADGGRMSTKPYVSGGAYLDRMSDYCSGCRFHPRKRVGETACPFTTLYWDYLRRHRSSLAGNHRLARQLAMLDRLDDLEAVTDRAVEVRRRLQEGTL